MNVISKPEPTEPDLSEAITYQSLQARMWRRSSRRSTMIATALFLLCMSEGLAIAYILPTIKFVPVFAFINEAGLLDTTSSISSLPPNTTVAGIETVLWEYVREREHYSASEAEQSYQIVSAMSSDHVQQQYQEWANPKFNAHSNASILKDAGYIRVHKLVGQFIEHAPDYMTGDYQIRYCYILNQPNMPVQEKRVVATLRYKLTDSVPLKDRTTFNPIGVVVTEYPGPEDEGAIGLHVPKAGESEPCAW